MGNFDPEAMEKNLSELFSDTFASVERDGKEIRVNCAELGPYKCKKHIRNQFDGSDGVVDGFINTIIGADVVLGEDFEVEEDGNTLVISEI